MNPASATAIGYTRRQIHTVFCGLVLLMFLGTIDQAIVAPALTGIGRQFGEFGSISWVVTAYLLTSASSTPLAGRLSDIYGRPAIVSVALGLLFVGSLLCAAAWNLDALIGGRAIQGLGGGALMALPNTIVGDMLSPRERGRYQVYISGTYAVSSLSGPLLGGLFAEHGSWRWIFWLHLPLILIALVISHLTLRQIHFSRRSHSIDYVGSFLMITSCTCLLLALTWGGQKYAWLTPQIVVLAVGFLIAGIGFVRWQQVALEPLLPPSVMRNPVIAVTSVGAVLITLVSTAFSVYFPSYLQSSHGLSIGQSGATLAGPLFGVVMGSYLAGQYVRRSGNYRLPPLAGIGLSIGMFLVLLFTGAKLEPSGLVFVTFLLGTGLGASLVPMMVASQNSVGVQDMGIATAVHTFFRAIGGSLGVAIFSSAILYASGSVESGGPSSLNVVGDLLREESARGFTILFSGCAGILTVGWLVLAKIPVIPLRTTAASLEATTQSHEAARPT
jgi:MFS family permease